MVFNCLFPACFLIFSFCCMLTHSDNIKVQDLKNRLGLDAPLLPVMNWGSLGVVATDTVGKIK